MSYLAKAVYRKMTLWPWKKIYKKKAQKSQIICKEKKKKGKSTFCLSKRLRFSSIKRCFWVVTQNLYICCFRCNFPHSVLLWCQEHKKRHGLHAASAGILRANTSFSELLSLLSLYFGLAWAQDFCVYKGKDVLQSREGHPSWPFLRQLLPAQAT